MPISVTCRNYEESYTVRDENAGRTFKCKSCGESVTVPDKRGRGPQGGGKSRTGGSRSESGTRSAPPAHRKKATRKRARRPVEDDYDDYDEYEDDDYDYAPRRSKPVRKSRSHSKKKTPRRSSSGLIESGDNIFHTYTSNIVLWFGIPFAIALLIAVFSLIVGPASMFAVVLVVVVCCVIGAASGLHSLILAFREDVACGLMILFVPFYNLSYLVTRWEEQKHPFSMELSMILTAFLSLFAAAAGAGG